ncbi:hypothetical protein EDB85DRAFT_2155199 [Lactarius pseudohatsudake]|nr:hypothetical protein EDB85DRAFT_2155199 [Lactarius pseudohatsudake]
MCFFSLGFKTFTRRRHASTPTPRRVLTLRHRPRAAPWCFDTNTAPPRHDTDAAPQQHGALALQHDTALSRHDTDAAPWRCDTTRRCHATTPTRRPGAATRHGSVTPQHRRGAAPTRRLDTATPTPRRALSQAIATAIYSQWHGRFVTGQVTSKKRAVKSEDDPNEEPAAKRHRATKSDPSPGPTSDCESNDGDAASMPKAIIPIDPLADVFDTLDATPFAVLNQVPEEIPPPTPVSSVAKLPSNSNPGGTQAVGRGTSPPLSSDSMAPEPGPSLVAPTTPSPAIETPTRPSSGTPPPSPPAIEPHIPGSTGTQISPGTPTDLRPAPAPPPNASLVPPSTSDASHSSSTMPSSGTGEEKKTSKTPKKYTGKGKMIPGGAITARNICARDWCVSHPEGTKGEFARHWDTLDPGSKAAYKHKETDAKALAKGKSMGRS